jgi:hypothetical protein
VIAEFKAAILSSVIPPPKIDLVASLREFMTSEPRVVVVPRVVDVCEPVDVSALSVVPIWLSVVLVTPVVEPVTLVVPWVVESVD